MPVKRAAPSKAINVSPSKKIKYEPDAVLGQGEWRDWPAPHQQIESARGFIREWSAMACQNDRRR